MSQNKHKKTNNFIADISGQQNAMTTINKTVALIIAGLILTTLVYQQPSGNIFRPPGIRNLLVAAMEASTDTTRNGHDIANLISIIQIVAGLNPVLQKLPPSQTVTSVQSFFLISKTEYLQINLIFLLFEMPKIIYTSFIKKPAAPPPEC